ncbi:PTS sugar transporter subunit IIB [Pseudoflavonifractor sp. DSM 107456]|uniref:PTS sugar transporter subunit IIB n=2 Tax=Pseudoflavonifractor TaxID=1017280 RepID=A0ABR9RDS5_9FIRM|nr:MULTISPECIES: PTS sugar transporter subunit IIB [Eubacteriales]MBC5730604.1 PTS sugar transporter subunit IIB [Pseudoflavonifractor hominis]MBE5056816.1 PTS sugar transporter subunit IIB [Pseudoflavonifractor gallinarum]MBS5136528.1 PTS sugar transporter subunit IIB [Oscillospiraceae bacterium]MBT9684378.1 PTS mannose/fructose/sorbose transporter subunit IIB [Pseudoflavonifractor sp. MCC625]
MSVVFYRIDDRLIHGQVMTGWSKVYQATRIFVVDDKTAQDQFLCQVMKMAVPRDYDVHIYTVEQALEAIANDPPELRTIVLAKTPDVMQRLLEGGAPMKELNLGGMGYVAGRKMILRNIQVSPAELEQLQAIAAKGVRVFCQIVPDGKCIEIDKVKL